MARVQTSPASKKTPETPAVAAPAPVAAPVAPVAPVAPPAPVAVTADPYAGKTFTVDLYRFGKGLVTVDAGGLKSIMAERGPMVLACLGGDGNFAPAADYFKPVKGKKGSNLPHGPRAYKPTPNNAAFPTLSELLAFAKPIAGHTAYKVMISDRPAFVFASGVYNALANACRMQGINATAIPVAELGEWAKQTPVESPAKIKAAARAAAKIAAATPPTA